MCAMIYELARAAAAAAAAAAVALAAPLSRSFVFALQ